jgi:prevent-host-death family protein
MSMKDITVSQLKAQLSKYLRMAARGTPIVVKDRTEPIARIVPLDDPATGWPERLARDGRLKLGTQDWSGLRTTKLRGPVDIQAALREVREKTEGVPLSARVR